MYTYICMYTCIYAYIYKYVHFYTPLTFLCTASNFLTVMYMHICIYTCINVYICTCICAYTALTLLSTAGNFITVTAEKTLTNAISMINLDRASEKEEEAGGFPTGSRFIGRVEGEHPPLVWRNSVGGSFVRTALVPSAVVPSPNLRYWEG